MLLTPEIHDLIDRALQEDLGIGDATTAALVPEDLQATATLFAKQPGVLCGVDVAAAVFRRVDPSLQVEQALRDGDFMERGSVALRVDGSAASLLMAERTAINFMQHLSGVATATATYVRPSRAPAPRSSTRARPSRACGRWKSTPSGAGAVTTTARTWATACSSRTTTSLR